MPSGFSSSKRTYEDTPEAHASKRARDGTRDGDHHRERSRDSYMNGRRSERDRRRDSRERDSRRGEDRYRPDDRGKYDRGRYDSRERDVDRKDLNGRSRRRRRGGRHRERDSRRSRSRSHVPTDSKKKEKESNGNGHVNDVEKEEGEISGSSSRSSSRSRSRSSVTRLSSKARSPPPPSVTAKPEPEKGPELELELESEKVEKPLEETIAERRARRQAIRSKYTGIASAALSVNASTASPSPGPSSAVLQPPSTPSVSDLVSQRLSLASTTAPAVASSLSNMSGRASPAPMSPSIDNTFDLAKHDEQQSDENIQVADGVNEQISAADYDPSLDRREDEEKRVRAVFEKDENHQDVEMIEVEEEEEDDVDDMFALDTTEKKPKKVKKVARPAAPALITTTLDAASDAEGYYQIILGEQLDGGRYQVFSSLGKGMFANVVRARILSGDTSEIGREVAIKIVRSQETMYKAGLKEAQILNKLRESDPDDKKHIVRLERTFEHRGHLCLVFEALSMNLRDVVKRFGKDVGLNIRAVRAYAHQLFLGLSLLRKCNIMHADIKPDNILVNEQKTVLKICDLGSASDASENEITPYLVSRFYRAPEIIMGVPYDCSLDVWSIGCTLYELYTGKILFPGRSNNQMLLLMMELKGRFNSKIIKKAKFGDTYFDDLGVFQSVERDKLTGADVIRKVHIAKPTKDMRARLLPSASKLSDEETRQLTSFVDLLDKCLMLDSSRRITPREALMHPFIRG